MPDLTSHDEPQQWPILDEWLVSLAVEPGVGMTESGTLRRRMDSRLRVAIAALIPGDPLEPSMVLTVDPPVEP